MVMVDLTEEDVVSYNFPRILKLYCTLARHGAFQHQVRSVKNPLSEKIIITTACPIEKDTILIESLFMDDAGIAATYYTGFDGALPFTANEHCPDEVAASCVGKLRTKLINYLRENQTKHEKNHLPLGNG